jgi:hypothetical protein
VAPSGLFDAQIILFSWFDGIAGSNKRRFEVYGISKFGTKDDM